MTIRELIICILDAMVLLGIASIFLKLGIRAESNGYLQVGVIQFIASLSFALVGLFNCFEDLNLLRNTKDE